MDLSLKGVKCNFVSLKENVKGFPEGVNILYSRNTHSISPQPTVVIDKRYTFYFQISIINTIVFTTVVKISIGDIVRANTRTVDFECGTAIG